MEYDIIFSQVGTPKSDAPQDIKAFLKVFLGSRRVVDMTPLIWWPILHFIILKKRPKVVSSRYRAMNESYGSNPTISISNSIIERLNTLQDTQVKFYLCYALDSESVAEVKKSLRPNSTKIVLPLFPQYSDATYQLIFDHTLKALNAQGACNFWAKNLFAEHSVSKIMRELSGTSIDQLYLSYHSYPLKRIEKGETYQKECEESFETIMDGLPNVISDKTVMSYQSKFGKGKWIGPLIEEDILKQLEKGKKNFAVYSPSFLTDSIETCWELGMELKSKVEEKGGTLKFIECLNADPKWIDALYNNILEKLP